MEQPVTLEMVETFFAKATLDEARAALSAAQFLVRYREANEAPKPRAPRKDKGTKRANADR